jgi:hypothetical protein
LVVDDEIAAMRWAASKTASDAVGDVQPSAVFAQKPTVVSMLNELS